MLVARTLIPLRLHFMYQSCCWDMTVNLLQVITLYPLKYLLFANFTLYPLKYLLFANYYHYRNPNDNHNSYPEWSLSSLVLFMKSEVQISWCVLDFGSIGMPLASFCPTVKQIKQQCILCVDIPSVEAIDIGNNPGADILYSWFWDSTAYKLLLMGPVAAYSTLHSRAILLH